MHESGIVEDLIGHLKKLSDENGGGRLLRVDVGLGVDAGFSSEHFEEHFRIASATTVAEGAVLVIQNRDGAAVTLEAVEVDET